MDDDIIIEGSNNGNDNQPPPPQQQITKNQNEEEEIEKEKVQKDVEIDKEKGDDDDDEDDPNYIFVKFINQKNQITHFKVRRTSKIENAFRSYCRHHHLQFGTARFYLNGDHIHRFLTPLELNLKDGVEIEVYSEVNGGSFRAFVV